MRLYLLFAILFLAGSAQAAIITVGHGGTQYNSIQEAIDGAISGDLIEVEAGIYNETVVVDKMVTLRGLGGPMVDTDGLSPEVPAILLSADGVVLEGFNVTSSPRAAGGSFFGSGIEVRSNSNTITGNTILNFERGVVVLSADNNTLSGNRALDNLEGMYLLDSGSNYLEGNNVSNNYGNGISLLYCKNNTLYRNNASLNLGMGIYLTGSVGNRIYGNDLVGNGDYNAYDDGNNSWDDGFLWGNHYGDFSCEDLEADNVCDSPYYIPGGSSIDRFPLAAYLMEVSFCEVADEIFTEWSEYINESDSIEDEDTKEPGVLNRVGL